MGVSVGSRVSSFVAECLWLRVWVGFCVYVCARACDRERIS